MGPGPAVGSAGGFVDAGQAALTGQPVVGPGFGPGAVNATPGAPRMQRLLLLESAWHVGYLDAVLCCRVWTGAVIAR